MSSEIDTLVEMRFPRNRVLIAHSEDPDIDKPYQTPTGHVLRASDTTTFGAEGGSEKIPVENSELSSNSADTIEQPQQALSPVCDDCGKRLRSENDVQLHAARSGHSNFSESTEEIKPLTKAEKKQQAERQRVKEEIARDKAKKS